MDVAFFIEKAYLTIKKCILDNTTETWE